MLEFFNKSKDNLYALFFVFIIKLILKYLPKSAINQLIAGLLIKNGFNYGCKIAVKGENFPTRVYEGLTLSAGYYDALIIELGSGQGDNWWCVVYPPLCFTGSDDITYRSKIWDLIKGR